jgi:hypothetical protein
VPTTKRTKGALLGAYLAEAHPERITEAHRRELQERLAPVSDRYLRDLLRSCGLPLDPLVEGIRQDSFEELERTLLAMGEEYARARQTASSERERLCRREVMLAKDHARLSARRAGIARETRSRKEEMASWMVVWLESPDVFPFWVRLRKRRLAAEWLVG